MTSRRDEARNKEIPDIIIDEKNNKKYIKGKFLGKGGFAKCYELTDSDTKQIMAGKIVPKSLLVKQHQKDKMTQEINIHRSLHHKHIVGFHGFFEDSDNVYILLELCRRRSLMELHKRRRAVTEPETRYFVRQILLATIYLHKTRVIHRDLKLGNLFMNDDMEVKIGDFGLATKVDYDGERKKTLCGTPNYIAPEVLCKKGHSFEVDVWSIGCILYTLLVGKPPFETANLKDTYTRIKRNEYHVPSRVSVPAKNLITRLLKADPTDRPCVEAILEDEFFSSGYMPPALPTSCLTMAPRFDMLKTDVRKPLGEINGIKSLTTSGKPDGVKPSSDPRSEQVAKRDDEPSDYWLKDLLDQVLRVAEAKPIDKFGNMDDAEDPACVPIYWVSKWVDYSDKYGLGYQLSDNSVGVLFNDSTRLLLTSNGENIQYIERDLAEYLHTLKVYPEALCKKVTLLKYFRNYMSEHLLKAGANVTPREGDEMTRLPFLRTWFRTRSAIILHLSNGTVQINFFQDHTKIILCPLMGAVSFINEKRDFVTYKLSSLEKSGIHPDLASRIRYGRNMIERLLGNLPKSGTSAGRPKQVTA